MRRKFPTLAVIPARGGSKGIPRKNLLRIGKLSLVGHAVKFAEESGFFDHILVSTDDEEISLEANQLGYPPEFLRTAEASHDRASSSDLLIEVDDKANQLGWGVERYVLLEPTSPMRTKRRVSEALELTGRDFDAALTLSPVDVKFHPDKQFTTSEDNEARFVTDRGRSVVARQQLSPTYIRNGFCYVVNSAALRETGSIFGTRLGAIVCDEPYVNIDSLVDVELCRMYMG